MRIIELDATEWKTVVDFYKALLASIGAPEWHGISPDALVDSMIWGGINAVEPPYTIKISGAAKLPKDVRDEVELAKQVLADGRVDYRSRRGDDVEVAIEIDS
jgi:Barstar (barnase inhibitor)